MRDDCAGHPWLDLLWKRRLEMPDGTHTTVLSSITHWLSSNLTVLQGVTAHVAAGVQPTGMTRLYGTLSTCWTKILRTSKKKR